METVIIGVQISVIGLAVVFFALALVAWILSYFDRIDAWLTRRRSQEQVKGTAASPEPDSEVVPPEIIAAITAAVAVSIDKKFKIKTVRYRAKAADPTWQVQGRATIMGSHHVPRQKR